MTTCKKILEAYLGCGIYEYLAKRDTNHPSRYDDITRKFKFLSVDIDTYDEDASETKESFDVSDNSEVQDLKSEVESLIDDLIEQYESRLYDIVNSYDDFSRLADDLLYHYDCYKIAISIYNFSKQMPLTENHLLLAKNDKTIFRTLISNY